MKLHQILSALVLFLAVHQYSISQESSETSMHGHSHYSRFSNTVDHKLIFPSKVPDRIIVNLTADPSHSFAVNWRTEQSVDTAYIEVALESHGPEIRIPGVARRIVAKTELFENENIRDKEALVKAAYHSVLVDKLEPGKVYAYRVGFGEMNDSTWSEWFQIEMPSPDVDAPFSFVYFGDAQNDVKSMWSRVIRKSYKMVPDVDFMLHAGDLINHSESNEEWGEWFYAGSYIHATVPSVMTPGNHEYRDGKLSSLWSPQFNLPQNGPQLEEMETYYTLDYQNMKLISFDAEQFDEHPESRKQVMKWLKETLSMNTRKWITLFMHYPIYSTAKGRDNKALREALKPLIDEYKVDLVLQGHDHTYARGNDLNKDQGKTLVSDVGTIYAVSVSGPKMYESQDQDWMARRGEYTQLFQIITVSKNTIKYQAFTPLGGLYDSFELQKDDNGKKKLINQEAELPLRLKKDFVGE
ncbi:purple acid phosphatase family protein [Zobellia alginiliquefaciens]|uniref:purple acid phosphatase family protein n=1 Tax=Zobellia alginiliquefaciens TaxID=3032586 RepID=UPI0023E405C3|nr:metallophosphoesterase family protein [Zobellia alginiliquefaciens]